MCSGCLCKIFPAPIFLEKKMLIFFFSNKNIIEFSLFFLDQSLRRNGNARYKRERINRDEGLKSAEQMKANSMSDTFHNLRLSPNPAF